MRFSRILSLALLAGFLPAGAEAQMAKKVLTQADWDRWRSITAPAISNDGKWAAYTLTPQVGDGEYVVRSTTAATEIRIPVGYIGRVNNTPGGGRGRAGTPGGAPALPAATGGRGQFSPDSRFAVITVGATKAVVDSVVKAQAATRTGGRGNAGRGANPAAGGAAPAGAAPATPALINPATRAQFIVIKLADGTQTAIDGRTPRFAQDNGKWMLYSPGADSAGTDSAGVNAGGGRGGAAGGGGRGGRGGGGGGGGGAAPTGGRRTYGNALVLRNMDTGAEERFTDILAAQFDDSAKVLVYTVASRDSTKDGIFIRDMSAGTVKSVLAGKGNYRGFTFDRAQQTFAFTSDRDEFGQEKARSTIYIGNVRTGAAAPVVTPAMWPPDMRLPDNGGAVSFTRNGNALVFALAPPAEDTIPADSLVGKAQFDLWHYKDPSINPTQKLRIAQDRNRTYQAIFNLTTKKIVQLGGDTISNVQLSDDAKVGLGTSGVRYSIESMWGDGGTDVYLVDPATAARKMIAERIEGPASLSVEAKYVTFYNAKRWYTYNIATAKTVDITGPVKNVHFEQETHSTPDAPNAWGIAGWTKGDRSILINDRFDIWEIDPMGVRPAAVITDSVGRRENMTFRIIPLGRDPEERAIDVTKALWLRAFDEDTKESGYYRDQVGVVKAPERVMMGAYNYGTPQKAKDADMYMMTRSTAAEFPNLWVGPSVTNVKKISDANPWQSEYVWPTAELVTWISDDGIPLQGILSKPDNFDPTKKYPMISYFYEDLSDGLYNYQAPNGGTSINVTHYVSNGYLVFRPDIHYETGHPGQSALKSIVPGVQMLLARGYVDPKKLGLQGHSWGGYQIAYMVTQTQMFSAAEAGAPVANMFSAYGGIRWESGVNRSGQYENGQSRIGQSIWEAPQLYTENSPLFGLPRVTTPLLILHNDNDGAVPWYQGIELYIGMRRLNKEAYLFVYNGEPHGIGGRANQKDWANRMQTFFDVKLKGAPEPEWMTKGILAKDKGKDQVNMPALQAGKIIRP